MSFHQHKATYSGRIPREGLHAGAVGSLIKRTLLNPVLTGAILLYARFTMHGRQTAFLHQNRHQAIKILAALGAVRILNNWLGRRAVNNGITDKSYDWTKEIVLVTGGSDGIGKQITLMLASRGIKVVVLDIQPLTYTPPPTVTYHHCDITSTSSIDRTATVLRTTLGAPTILINNAGVCRGKPLLENTDADLALTFNVNTIAHYKLAREFVPDMIAHNHGMVVTVASSAAWVTAPRMTEYAASKAAALAFHEGLAAELIVAGAPKVRTVVVNQGYTQTSLFQGFGRQSNAFLEPALHVETVAEAIVEQVLKGESGQIILPGIFKLVAANIRSLPDWLAYPTRAGLAGLMANWKGRQVEMPGLTNDS